MYIKRNVHLLHACKCTHNHNYKTLCELKCDIFSYCNLRMHIKSFVSHFHAVPYLMRVLMYFLRALFVCRKWFTVFNVECAAFSWNKIISIEIQGKLVSIHCSVCPMMFLGSSKIWENRKKAVLFSRQNVHKLPATKFGETHSSSRQLYHHLALC